MPLGHHIRIRLKDSRVIAPREGQRRIVARAVLKLGALYGLLAFRCADTHLHIESACDRSASGEYARRVEISLAQRLHHDVGFQEARIDPIVDQHHLFKAFDYVLRQDVHHGCRMDPFHDASVLPELLRFRVGPTCVRDNVEALLPRVTPAMLAEHLGGLRLDHEIVTFGPLVQAAAAAVALPTIDGNEPLAVLARAAAARLAAPHMRRRDLAELLGKTPRSVRDLLRRTPPARLVEAVELQLRLRQQRPPRKL